ncbi:hypothetical protein TRAPUB_8321, partial [Trametes pubescens]
MASRRAARKFMQVSKLTLEDAGVSSDSSDTSDDPNAWNNKRAVAELQLSFRD